MTPIPDVNSPGCSGTAGNNGANPKTENKKKDTIPKTEAKQEKKKDSDTAKIVCKFYTNGRFNKNSECKFSHPRICRKFNQFA